MNNRGKRIMKEIPVTIRFDYRRVIGTLQVDESQLPNLPDYHFALRVVRHGTQFEIREISVIPDSQFKNWDELNWEKDVKEGMGVVK